MRVRPFGAAGSHGGTPSVGFREEEVALEEAAHTLRERERLLANEYGVGEPPEALDGEDLESDELADVEYWVDVYTQLVDFTRSLLSASPGDKSAGDTWSDQTQFDLRAVMLQAQVQELHLTYWVDRLNRMRRESAAGGDRPEAPLKAGQPGGD